MKTAFSYHRFSHDDQRKGHTLEVQREITKKLAQKYEATIIQIYEDEAISGATIDKRAFLNVLGLFILKKTRELRLLNYLKIH